MGRLCRRTRRLLLVVLAVSSIGVLPGRFDSLVYGDAPFPIIQSFMGASAPGWVIGGNAVLTAGTIDPLENGWLRLTSNVRSQLGYAYYDTALPTTEDIEFSFDYAAWGGTGNGDGVALVLFDGSTSVFTPGHLAGSLGYANGCRTPGLSNGYVAVGFDEFGNFGKGDRDNCHHGGAYSSIPGVTIRGSGNGSLGYTHLSTVARNDIMGDRLHYRSVVVGLTADQKLTVRVRFDADGPYLTVIDRLDLGAAPAQEPLPPTLKLGFVGTTGLATNIHEIRNVSAATAVIQPLTSTPTLAGALTAIATSTTTPTATPSDLPTAIVNATPVSTGLPKHASVHLPQVTR